MKYSIFLLLSFLVACDYNQDQLLIQNETDKEICSELLIKNKTDNLFQSVAVNLIVKPHEAKHPIRRTAISSVLKDKSADTILYIVFHNSSDREYILKNINKLVADKRCTVKRLSKQKLDSLNWTVKYD